MKVPAIKFARSTQDGFFPVLRERVDQWFQQQGISQKGGSRMVYKSLGMLSLYIALRSDSYRMVYAPSNAGLGLADGDRFGWRGHVGHARCLPWRVQRPSLDQPIVFG